MLSHPTDKEKKNCFSETNFETVYQYLDNKITTQELIFYAHGNYEIYLIRENEIKIKYRGWSMAIISKERGIFALAKSKSDNEKQLKKANEIFCQLVVETETNGLKPNASHQQTTCYHGG